MPWHRNSRCAASLIDRRLFKGPDDETLHEGSDRLRCGNDLANPSNSRTSVFLKFGEPVFEEALCKPTDPASIPNNAPDSTIVNVVPFENVDEWPYNPRYGQFMTPLRFESSKLESIRYGDRVK